MLGEIVWWAGFLAFNAMVAVWDLRARRVPNSLLLLGLCAQGAWLLTTVVLSGQVPAAGARGLADALAACLLGILFVVFWKLRAMGAGDVKYLAVLGLMLGVRPWLAVLLLASLPALLHALAQSWSVLRNPRKPRRGIPYAAYLALAAVSLAFMPWSSPWCSWCSSWWSTAF